MHTHKPRKTPNNRLQQAAASELVDVNKCTSEAYEDSILNGSASRCCAVGREVRTPLRCMCVFHGMYVCMYVCILCVLDVMSKGVIGLMYVCVYVYMYIYIYVYHLHHVIHALLQSI
jgi:hypothetical protein